MNLRPFLTFRSSCAMQGMAHTTIATRTAPPTTTTVKEEPLTLLQTALAGLPRTMAAASVRMMAL